MATLVMERTGSADVSPADEAETAPSEMPGDQTGIRQRIIDCDVHHETSQRGGSLPLPAAPVCGTDQKISA